MIFRTGCISLGIAMACAIVHLEMLSNCFLVAGALAIVASVCILISRFMP